MGWNGYYHEIMWPHIFLIIFHPKNNEKFKLFDFIRVSGCGSLSLGSQNFTQNLPFCKDFQDLQKSKQKSFKYIICIIVCLITYFEVINRSISSSFSLHIWYFSYIYFGFWNLDVGLVHMYLILIMLSIPSLS